MNKEAGISMAAVPNDITAIGNVARLLSSASCRPTTAESVAISTDDVCPKDCAAASRMTLFHLVGVWVDMVSADGCCSEKDTVLVDTTIGRLLLCACLPGRFFARSEYS